MVNVHSIKMEDILDAKCTAACWKLLRGKSGPPTEAGRFVRTPEPRLSSVHGVRGPAFTFNMLEGHAFDCLVHYFHGREMNRPTASRLSGIRNVTVSQTKWRLSLAFTFLYSLNDTSEGRLNDNTVKKTSV